MRVSAARRAALRIKFAAHGLQFDLSAELTRVRHAAVALALPPLRAVEAVAPAAAPASPASPAAPAQPRAAPALPRGAGASGGGEFERLTPVFQFAFRVHQFCGGFDHEAGARFAALAARLLALSQQRAGTAPPKPA
jgi:hypothetical protein